MSLRKRILLLTLLPVAAIYAVINTAIGEQIETRARTLDFTGLGSLADGLENVADE